MPKNSFCPNCTCVSQNISLSFPLFFFLWEELELTTGTIAPLTSNFESRRALSNIDSISNFHYCIIKSMPSAASSAQSRIFPRISLYFPRARRRERKRTSEPANERLTSFISSSDLVHFPADALGKCSHGRAGQWYTVGDTFMISIEKESLFKSRNVASMSTLDFLPFLYLR